MAALVVIGIATALIATEPEKSASPKPITPRIRARIRFRRAAAAYQSFAEFPAATWRSSFSFVVIYKFCDAFAAR
jgi:PAT family beta-lactamase induction signal transducer AmpG